MKPSQTTAEEIKRTIQAAAKQVQASEELRQVSQALQRELEDLRAHQEERLATKAQRAAAGQARVEHGTPPEGAAPKKVATPAPKLALPMPLNAKAAAGLEVYALHELSRFAAAMRGLGADITGPDTAVVWLPDTADAQGRAALKAYPVTTIGEHIFIMPPGPEAAPRFANNIELAQLEQGEWVPVTPEAWEQVNEWENLGGFLLSPAENGFGGGSLILWIILFGAAFALGRITGVLILVAALFLIKKWLQPYHSAYFEDEPAPNQLRELAWHQLSITGKKKKLLLLPQNLKLGGAGEEAAFMSGAAPAAHPATAPAATPAAPLLDQLPEGLAAGLKAIYERSAELPQEAVVTPEGYRLSQLLPRCEEAAQLYLRLPSDSEAARVAEGELQAMFEEALITLGQAGPRSQQEQEATLKAIRELRIRSGQVPDPLRIK